MSKRSYYYRRSKRTYPKQKWQMSVVDCTVNWSNLTFGATTFYAKHALICQTPVPTTSAAGGLVAANNIVKTGNFRVKGTFSGATPATYGTSISAIVYVIFIPQGISPDNTAVSKDSLATSVFYSHPEWVLGWTRVNMNEQGSDSFYISSRLKRNLNSGDSIQFGVLLVNDSGTSYTYGATFKATISYTARAN